MTFKSFYLRGKTWNLLTQRGRSPSTRAGDVPLEEILAEGEHAELQLDMHRYERPLAVSPSGPPEALPTWGETHAMAISQGRSPRISGAIKSWRPGTVMDCHGDFRHAYVYLGVNGTPHILGPRRPRKPLKWSSSILSQVLAPHTHWLMSVVHVELTLSYIGIGSVRTGPAPSMKN